MRKKLMNTKFFFDNNINFYSNTNIYDYDRYITDFIKRNSGDKRYNLLDIGGSIGTFAKFIIKSANADMIVVIDQSVDMLKKIKDGRIEKIAGVLPYNIPLKEESFDYVHVKEVFHHVTDNSIVKTKVLFKESLSNIKILLKDDGVLFVHEIFYESPLIQSLFSSIIYYICKIQNKLGVKIPKKEFLLGLDVYFYTRKELYTILTECGFEILFKYQTNWRCDIKKRLALLKNWGRIILICKKKDSSGFLYGV